MTNVQQWIMLIAAVAAAIVSIINAWRGQKVEQKLTALAIKVASTPSLPGTAPGAGITLGNALRFWDLLSNLIGVWSGFRGMKAGDTAPVPEIRTKIDGHHYRLFGAQIQKED